MRSSSRHATGIALIGFAVLALTSCNRTAEQAPQQEASAGIECTTSGLTGAGEAEALAEMRRTIAGGPAYGALARLSPPRSCRGTGESGEVSLEYSFANGDTLTLARNPAIEYSQQEARFSSARDLPALAILRQMERSSFSPDGCGMDWNEPTTTSEADDPAVERVYYGETCNCQARVREDRDGKALGFVFRSAC